MRPQIASGDLLRAAVRNKTALGLEAKGFMDKGALVPDELVLKLIDERLRSARRAKAALSSTAFRARCQQAETLAKMLEARSEQLDKVVAIIVPDDEMIKRISGRRTCRNCGAMYHVIYDPPRNMDMCNSCNGELYQRDDDAEDTVRDAPGSLCGLDAAVAGHYEQQGLLAQIDGIGRPEEIEKRILDGART